MTGTHTHHSANAIDILHMLIAQAKPMTAADGSAITNSGYLKTKLHGSKIVHINSFVEIVSWANSVMTFNFEGKRYTAKTGKASSANHRRATHDYTLTWNHGDPCDRLTASDLWDGAL